MIDTNLAHKPHSLTMSQSNPTGHYDSHENAAQRRDFMRNEAILMLESLNTGAMGTGITYYLKEASGSNGYAIFADDHTSIAVWMILGL